MSSRKLTAPYTSFQPTTYRTRSAVEKCSFTWIVEDLSLCCGEDMESEVFPPAAKCKWVLLLHPDPDEPQKTSVLFSLRLGASEKAALRAKGTFSVRDSSGKRIYDQEFDRDFKKSESWCCYRAERAELSKLLKDDILQLHVQITAAAGIVSGVCEALDKQKPDERLMDDFGSLLSNPRHSDLTICVDGKEVRTHQSVLAARSKVFAAMFEHDTIEKTARRVVITDIDYETFDCLLHFIYTSRVGRYDLNVTVDLLKAADKYALEDLKFLCGDHLVSCINLTNVVDLFLLADTYSVPRLKEEATDYIYKHISRFGLKIRSTLKDQRDTDLIVATE